MPAPTDIFRLADSSLAVRMRAVLRGSDTIRGSGHDQLEQRAAGRGCAREFVQVERCALLRGAQEEGSGDDHRNRQPGLPEMVFTANDVAIYGCQQRPVHAGKHRAREITGTSTRDCTSAEKHPLLS
jgi:hypothetical protein